VVLISHKLAHCFTVNQNRGRK